MEFIHCYEYRSRRMQNTGKETHFEMLLSRSVGLTAAAPKSSTYLSIFILCENWQWPEMSRKALLRTLPQSLQPMRPISRLTLVDGAGEAVIKQFVGNILGDCPEQKMEHGKCLHYCTGRSPSPPPPGHACSPGAAQVASPPGRSAGTAV